MRKTARSLAYALLPTWLFLLSASAAAWQENKPYPFGVLNQRSVTLTAAYWNPILSYLERKSGVPLTLRIARTANETTDMAARDELAFVYTNHLFTPERAKLGYRVLARQEGPRIHGQVVVPADSRATNLADLAGKRVAFANPYAFAGYFLPYDAILQANVDVVPMQAGNQEAAMGLLKHGQVAAAGVNSQVMTDFARRENLGYRILYSSEPYFDLCIMAHPNVPAKAREAVQLALINMRSDPEGLAVLAGSARLLALAKPRGFVAASDADYDNYRAFFRQTRVPLDNQ